MMKPACCESNDNASKTVVMTFGAKGRGLACPALPFPFGGRCVGRQGTPTELAACPALPFPLGVPWNCLQTLTPSVMCLLCGNLIRAG